MRRPSIQLRLASWYTALTILTGLILLVLVYLLVVPSLPNFLAVARATPFNPANTVPAPRSSTSVAVSPYNLRGRVGTSIITLGAVALLALAVLSACLGWLLAGRVLDPVRAVTATARRIAERNLHERIALKRPADELKELADTFDAMVGRLERSFDGQRRFVANASHELRTPLATARAVAEVAATAPNASPDARRLGTRLLTIAVAQERLLDSLLALAQDESTIDRTARVDLAVLAVEAVAAHQHSARAAGVELHTELVAAPLLGDSALLTRVVHNLVDNAIRYNRAEDGWVRIRVGAAEDGRARLCIVNPGSMIDPSDASALFEPFRRLHHDRTDHPRGSGLGLSVVRVVVQAHHGTVHAEPRAGGGLAVHVALPTDDEPPRS
ncbi:HAMP domain-containing histidine kinase [Catenulispora sp. NL8]|uniref:histidine kinase n=1 Tax=Catenulispora pinistramenti TaxID=2705254 RepID=A0ABS5KY16_9ACTN|nr:HAMP domain-containing sensor histidine kinase [Catenulispora pinistramenti]MBS2550955.1 HAMP domain-containing histidine kinase [Catenulispora pinistramenti]